MKEIIYRKAERPDIPKLIELRLAQLEEEGGADTPALKPALELFYKTHLAQGSFLSWLAVKKAHGIVAVSGLSFYEKPPYAANLSGKLGVLSHMDTLPAFRRQGIASQLLGRIEEEALRAGCGGIEIKASSAGVPLYKNYGFADRPGCMYLSID